MKIPTHKYLISVKDMILYGILLFYPFLGVYRGLSATNKQGAGFLFFIVYLSTFIFFLYYRRYKIIVFKQGSLAVIFFIVLITIGYCQYLLYGNMSLGKSPPIFVPLVLFLVYVLISTVKEKLNPFEILKFMFYSYLLFFCINIILYFLGISFLVEENCNEGFHQNILASMDRGSLPLFMHAVETSEGGFLAIAIAYILLLNVRNNMYFKVIFSTVMVLGLYAILLGGSRTALIGTIMLLLIGISKLYRSKKINLIILSLLFFFPFWYTPLVSYLGDSDIASIFSRLSRTGDYMEVLTLNNRTEIWSHTFSSYIDNIDILHLLFGYGYGGQSPSGIAASFTYIFSFSPGGPGYETMHVHNSTLQVLIDYGIVGVALFAHILFRLLIFFSLNKNYEVNMLLFVFMLIGAFGIAPVQFSYFSVFLFSLMVLFLDKSFVAQDVIKNKILAD